MTGQLERLSARDACGPEPAPELAAADLEREVGAPFRRELPMGEVIRRWGQSHDGHAAERARHPAQRSGARGSGSRASSAWTSR